MVELYALFIYSRNSILLKIEWECMSESDIFETSSEVFDSHSMATSTVKVRLAEIKAAENHLLEAARPLLRVAADMRVIPMHEDMHTFQEFLVREIKIFQNLAEQAAIKREHIIVARYCLCTCLDEFAGIMGTWPGEAWAASSILTTFHKEVYGGEKFFQLLGRLAQSPVEHHEILELMSHIMGLGYAGRYARRAGGEAELLTIRQRVHALIQTADTSMPALAPNWRGEMARRTWQWDIPLWLSGGLLALLLLGIFGWNKYQVSSKADVLEARIEKLGEHKPVEKPARPLNLVQLLKNEIAKGVVKVTEEGTTTTVIFTGDNMFTPGSAEVNATIKPTLDKVASEINLVSGKVVVLGHTDSSPIKSPQFADNQALSEQRAQSISSYLQTVGVLANRLTAQGKGDTVPVADNSTKAGKAKNRRVEVLVVQE